MPRDNAYHVVNIQAPDMDWNQDENLYNRFKLWKQQCELILSSDLQSCNDERKKAYVLRWSGTEGLRIYNSWQITNTPHDTLNTIWQKFEEFAKPTENALRSRYELWHTVKKGNSSVQEYYATVCNKSQASFPSNTFGPAAVQELTRDAFIFGIRDENLKHEFIAENTSLEHAFNKVKLLESAKLTVNTFKSSAATEVNQMRHKRTKQFSKRHGKRKQIEQQGRPNKRHKTHNEDGDARPGYYDKTVCFKCGYKKHTTSDAVCPAKNKRCKTCNKMGHFTTRCYRNRSKTIKEITELYGEQPVHRDDSECEFSSDSSDMNTSSIDAIHAVSNVKRIGSVNKAFLVTIPVTVMKHHKRKFQLPAKIDTGAEVSVMSKPTYVKLTNDKTFKYIKPSDITLKSYEDHVIRTLGYVNLYTCKGHKQYCV